MHISKAKAAERALELATAFMRKQDTRGWDWALGHAIPHSFDPCHNEHKIATKWIVTVQYSKRGTMIDGPAILQINLIDNSVVFIESC